MSDPRVPCDGCGLWPASVTVSHWDPHRGVIRDAALCSHCAETLHRDEGDLT